MIALRRMLDQQPEVGVRPAAMTSLHIFEALRNGRISVGIVRGPVTDPDVIASVPLAEVPVDHVVVPPDHRLATFDRVDITDLEGEPVLIVERDDAPRAHDEITHYFAETRRPPAVDRPRRDADRTGLRHGVRRGRHRLAQHVAGRARVRPDRRRDPAAGSRRHARRVPHRLARRRHQPGHRDLRPSPPRGLRRLRLHPNPPFCLLQIAARLDLKQTERGIGFRSGRRRGRLRRRRGRGSRR